MSKYKDKLNSIENELKLSMPVLVDVEAVPTFDYVSDPETMKAAFIKRLPNSSFTYRYLGSCRADTEYDDIRSLLDLDAEIENNPPARKVHAYFITTEENGGRPEDAQFNIFEYEPDDTKLKGLLPPHSLIAYQCESLVLQKGFYYTIEFPYPKATRKNNVAGLPTCKDVLQSTFKDLITDIGANRNKFHSAGLYIVQTGETIQFASSTSFDHDPQEVGTVGNSRNIYREEPREFDW